MPVWRLRAVDLRMCSQSESEVVASWTCEQPRALSWVSHKQEEERDLVGWDHLKQKTGVTEKEWGASCQKTSPQYHRVCCSIWNGSRRQYLSRHLKVFFVGRRRLPALNFPHSLSSPSFLVFVASHPPLSADPLLAARSPGGAVALI